MAIHMQGTSVLHVRDVEEEDVVQANQAGASVLGLRVGSLDGPHGNLQLLRRFWVLEDEDVGDRRRAGSGSPSVSLLDPLLQEGAMRRRNILASRMSKWLNGVMQRRRFFVAHVQQRHCRDDGGSTLGRLELLQN